MGIQLNHVTKSFGSYLALNDVNLRVDRGELVALLGPSGSGKSTLLRIIAGLETPDANPETSVLFDGQDVVRRRVGERQVGFVFQHYALFKHMNVWENIAFGLKVRPRRQRPRRAEIRDKVAQLLRLIQLESLGHRYPSQLSGGQRQRVALARALAIEPQVLLLDEPFGALDAKVRQGLRNWLRRLHDELHVTSILVTHDQEEALEVADRVVVMNQARIEQVGTPAEVFHHPASEFVMDFLGDVNVFHGRIENGRAVHGGLSFDAPGPVQRNGDQAKIYVRPHELHIERHRNGMPAIKAAVQRINHAGSCAKVSLTTSDGNDLQVEIPLDQCETLRLLPGETVYVSARHARVFTPEYLI
jgi:sulfate transport system ATP-binding protein